MNRTQKLLTALLATLVLGLGATAQAQDTPPPASPPPAETSHSSSSIPLSGGAGIGIGVTVALSPLSFPAGLFVYDTGLFHIEGILGFTSQPAAPGASDRTNEWIFGAGGWYHLHKGSSSDFSLGGIIAIDYTSFPGGSTTLTALEPGIQVRAFLTPNVAVHARGGLSILLGDAPNGGANFYLGGQPVLFWGFSYFFR
jgi:hypothetical protein